MDAMETVGFVPNPAARALSTNRTRTIAAVIPTLSHSIFASFLNGIEVELAAEGYALVIATTDNSKSAEEDRSLALLDMGAEALILSGAEHNPGLLKQIYARKIPTLCTSIFSPDYELPTVGYDNFAVAADAVEFLRGLGHRQLAILHGPTKDNDRTRERLAGVHDRLQDGMTAICIETDLSSHGGVSAIKHFLTLEERPTAILCLSDVLALGASFELQRQGVSIPQDVSIMGFDDLEWADIHEPGLTSIHLPTTKMGQKSAQLLVDLLENGTPIEHTKLETRIIVRGTTARI